MPSIPSVMRSSAPRNTLGKSTSKARQRLCSAPQVATHTSTAMAVVPLCEALRLCGSSVHPVEVDVTWVKADPDALWIETEGPRRRFDPSRLFRPGQLRRFTLRIAFPGEPGGTYRPATGVLVTHDNGELTYHLSASEAQLLVAMGQTRWVLEVRRAQAHGRAYGEHG